MENNDLKENIRKNVKERIAISNIRKEFEVRNNKNSKVIYWITSGVVAVFILGFGIMIGTNTFNNRNMQNLNYEIADSQQDTQNNEESLKMDLQINKINEIGIAKLDADVETINAEKLPEEFKFIENIIIPKEFKLLDMYKIYVRSNPDIREYDSLHDYVLVYKKDDENDIRIALSTVAEPIRDYYLGDNNKISKIGDVELKISQYEEMYMTTFKIKNMYFDIETNGITENELVELLQSIITKSKI